MNRAGEQTTVLNLSDMSRCLSCRRLVTLRRILREGACKCGSRRVNEVTFLDEHDALEIEEEYGWDVLIKGVGENNVSKGLLQGGDRSEASHGRCTLTVSETRLHSAELAGRGARAERGKYHNHLARARFLLGTPLRREFWDPRKWNDYLRSLRRVQVRGARLD